MNKLLAALLLLLPIAGCGGSQTQADDDDHYTQEDLERDTDDVYRPSNSGEDGDGVEKGSREKPTRTDTVETSKDPGTEPKKDLEPKVEPKKEPGPKVEQPKKDPEPKVEQPKKDPEPKVEPKKDRNDLIAGFISNVSNRMDGLEGSKAWKEFLKAKEKFDERLDKALEKGNDERGKDAEAAWAEAIKAWYEVRYVHLLFLHLNQKAGKDFEPGAGLNFDELQVYSDEQLKSDACAQTYAAYELAEPEMKQVRQFQTDVLKYDLVASKVFTDAKQEKKWATEKKKWQEATEGKFDEKEVKKYRE
ncbi:MAG: hypothetical protein H6841_11260 [Planctomycetes bacterium]|nr:hypothetical protein [Planctomycetota bacterium]